MTSYEQGFTAGENEAWKGRGSPLPKPPVEIRGDQMQGFWDARIPRNPLWARQRRIAPARWDEEQSRYFAGKKAA